MSEADQVTNIIAEFAAGARFPALPGSVVHEAKRCFLNFIGCASGGATHDVIDITERALSPFGGSSGASVIGRGRRADPFFAALLNATSNSAHSFDDTHAEAVVHGGGPVGSALLALAETRGATGEDFVLGFALGLETMFRLSKAISVAPAVLDIAWYQTGVTGGVGAAIAAAKLLRLDQSQINAAIGIAVAQASGVRITQGSMCMLLSAGHAAQVGLRAALLAAEGFESPTNTIEGQYGFTELFSKQANVAAITADLGKRFEVLSNTYKAYPCGIVVHPVVDACLELQKRNPIDAEAIEKITVRLTPVALTLTDRPHPKARTDAQVSIQHWAAIALMTGRAGLEEGTLDVICRPDVVVLRGKVAPLPDKSLPRGHTEVTVHTRNGQTFSHFVDRPRGSLENPMTDADLEEKFIAQAKTRYRDEEVSALIEACWKLDTTKDVRSIGRLLAPG